MATVAVEQWTGLHQRAAILAASGIELPDIARVVGKTEAWVEAVLKTDRAVAVEAKFYDDLQRNLFEKYKHEYIELLGLSIRNLKRTLMMDIDTEVDFTKKKHQDRVSLEVMKLAKASREEKDLGGIQLTREQSDLLIEAISTAEKAKESHADFEIIESEKNGK